MPDSLAQRFAARLWLLLPLAVVGLLAVPYVGFMLPSYESSLGEDYQPLMALKFYASLGREFHKYGPMSNFLLAPVYGPSMVAWWLDGSFAPGSRDFPYGFAAPLEQLSWLLLSGRLVFMAVFLMCSAYCLWALRALTANTTAIAAAFVLCVATDYTVAEHVANTRPDGPMYAFVVASLGTYAAIFARGLTRPRGVALSLLAVCAISAKEIAGPLYVLPYLGVLAAGWRTTAADPAARREFAHAYALSLATGVAAYLALNVVYAPSTWLLRMDHWLLAEGTDSSVWGGLGSGAMTPLGYAAALCAGFLNVLGPGGLPVALIAVAAWARARPARGWLLALPFASVFLLGILPLGYVGDHFHSVAGIAALPLVVAGLAQLFARARAGTPRIALSAALALALAANLLFATFAWHLLEGMDERLVERSLAAHPIGGRSVNVLDSSSRAAGKSRLEWLGYRVDPRSVGELAAAEPDSRPDRIYAATGLLLFLDNAKRFPARADLLRSEGTDVATWRGVEALGYRRVASVEADTPWWFPFDWMPPVRHWRERNPVLIYERTTAGAQ